MNLVAGLVVFFLTWWVVLFAILPLGIRHPEKPEVGMMPGAPLKPDFNKIILRTTLVTIVIWLIIYGLAESNLISFQRMAKDMA